MAEKLWTGRTSGKTDFLADDFNSSISFDKRMFKEDIKGSIAHAEMLAKQGIISKAEAEKIKAGLEEIKAELEISLQNKYGGAKESTKEVENGPGGGVKETPHENKPLMIDASASHENKPLEIDETAEDIHMFIESALTELIGEVGKKLHTARSRNDQVTLDLRMYLMSEIDDISANIKALAEVLTDQAEIYKDAIMPGYTHLQRAQPITFGHHLMAYVMMLLRDLGRLSDCKCRMNVSPIGSCALAGTTYDTDRAFEAKKLGFAEVCHNSMDGVSDRDFALELLSDISILMMHLSRLSEELIFWTSWEFKFVELSDAYTTGSSIMPQKKNSDMAELIRGKCGRVYGDLIALLTTMKGLPLAYNKDMQEDKEGVFDACDTARACLTVMAGMIKTMKPLPENMKKAAQTGFINATDIADYLVKKGLPFRDAYKISGEIVAKCIEENKTLETLPIEKYKKFSGLFDTDIYEAADLQNVVNRRVSFGGPGKDSVSAQIAYARSKLRG